MSKLHYCRPLAAAFALLPFGVLADDGAQALAAKLAVLYPKTEFTTVAASPLPGVYEVTMGRTVAFVGDDGRHFIFGHLFDMKTQRDLTAAKLTAASRADFAALPLSDAIRTVQGNGSRKLVVFADPDCPYCRQLEPELAKLRDVTIYTFLYPLDSLHPEAKAKAVSVWCQPDRAAAWRGLMTQNRLPQAASCDHPIDRNAALAAKLRITGTPTLIASDGRIRAGALSAEEINVWLAELTKEAAR